jgi:nucleoside-diphosphate-sugar epimerase
MNILITGGAGFVGKNLVRIMLKRGFKPQQITVIDKDKKGIDYLKKYKINLFCHDLSEKGIWELNFRNQDLIINLAAQISANDYLPFKKNNIDATKNIVEAAKSNKIKKIIHFSSASVLSVRKDYYAKTKKAAEEIIKKSRMNYIMLRPSMMFGLLDNKNIGWLIKFSRIVPIFPIPGNGKYPRQPIYVDDVCELVIKLAKSFEKHKNKIYSINGKMLDFGYMCRTVVKKVGGFRTAINFPVPLFRFGMVVANLIWPKFKFTPDQLDSLTSGDKFDQWEWWKDFNIKLTSFEEGVGRMVKEM